MPIPLALIPAIVGGATAIGQTFFGTRQYRKGKEQMAELERPEYEIPGEVEANLEAAKAAKAEGLDPYSKDLYVEGIGRSTMGAMGSLQDRGLGVAGASGIFQKQSDAYRNLLGLDAQARDRQKEVIANNLAQARLTSAGFKERQFDINMFQPYMQDYMAAQSMTGAGMQNIGLGFGSLAKSAGMGATALEQTGSGVAQPGPLPPGASSLNLQQNPNPMQAYGGWGG